MTGKAIAELAVVLDDGMQADSGLPAPLTPLEAQILSMLSASGRCPPELLHRDKITLALKLLLETFVQVDAARAQAIDDVRHYKAALHSATRS